MSAARSAFFDSAGSALAPIPRRPLGKTGLEVSILGLAGACLGDMKDEAEAIEIAHRAIDAGVNVFDSDWAYHDDASERRLGKAIRGRREQVVLMANVCTHGRDASVALKQLEDSLERLGTDYVDVWQIHDCVYYDAPWRHFRRGGVVWALAQAKQQGKARFVGFTGEKDPAIHLAMLETEFPFDTCQMPLNCLDAGYARSFERTVLPEVNRRQIAPLGTKTLCGSRLPATDEGVVTVCEALRYAMSLPVATTIADIDSLVVLRHSLAAARAFQPHGTRARETTAATGPKPRPFAPAEALPL